MHLTLTITQLLTAICKPALVFACPDLSFDESAGHMRKIWSGDETRNDMALKLGIHLDVHVFHSTYIAMKFTCCLFTLFDHWHAT